MCGIAGELGSTKYIPFNPWNIQKMTQAITHRGPDDYGYYSDIKGGGDSEIAAHLGTRRLSIIDREHGRQPWNGFGIAVVFNGEIYNHNELRKSVNLSGQIFLTHCDTEVIFEAYRVFKNKFIDYIEGMFSIAIWDGNQNKLKLFRDRMGKKPLYYYYNPDKNIFLFASEIKAILANPLYSKEINWSGIGHYVCLQYVPEPETAYAGIKALMPGHMLEYNPLENKIEITKYWELKPIEVENDYETQKSLVYQEVTNAIHKRLESEVPVGVYLSGGIDSAIVTAIAAMSGKVKELHTFTMGFLEDAYNEIPSAKYISEMYDTVHHTEMVRDISLIEMANKIVDQYDQPFGDCSAIPTLKLAELSKQYITVALTGDGADEAFGGYPRYWHSSSVSMFLRMMTIWQKEGKELICKKEFNDNYFSDSYIYLLRCLNNCPPKNDIENEMMFIDSLSYLPNDIIVKMERAAMAYSIEARCPFLDSKVFELAVSIPSQAKISENHEGKFILKDAFRGVLPKEIMSLPKRGFAVPMNEWLRNDEGQKLLSQTILNVSENHPVFNKVELNKAIMAHLMGKANLGHGLWILIILELWLRKNL